MKHALPKKCGENSFNRHSKKGECDTWWWGTNKDGSHDPITEEPVIKETVLTPRFKLEVQGQ